MGRLLRYISLTSLKFRMWAYCKILTSVLSQMARNDAGWKCYTIHINHYLENYDSGQPKVYTIVASVFQDNPR